MRVIFLDIDGVLVTLASARKKRRPAVADASCVAALNFLVANTGAVLVITSAWRIGTPIEKFQPLFDSWGIKARVFGSTGQRQDSRGIEIAKWLKYPAPKFLEPEPVESFVILDDDADMGMLLPRLVQTNHLVGLTMSDAEQAIKILEVPI